MGFVWNAIHLEAGIDGIVEIRDPVSAEVSNCIIQVQSKAGDSYFRSETDIKFEFYCDERDLDYWRRGNAPVVLVVSRPDDNEAYWVSVKDYFDTPRKIKAKKITFDKRKNVFNASCRQQLATLAFPKDSGHYLSAVPTQETLHSNLLQLKDYPSRLFKASTKLRFPNQVWEKLNKAANPAPPEWLLHNGFIYSFHDLSFPLWQKVCLGATVENRSTVEWALSEDRRKRYVFVRLLNSCIGQLLWNQGIRYSKKKKHYFFKPTTDLSERKVGGLSVFKAYQSKTNPDRIAYYRHRAMTFSPLRFDGCWYLEITPSYHFTHNGWGLSRLFEERLKMIKQIERQNKVHFRQVRLWVEVLQQMHLIQEQQTVSQLSLFGADTLDDGDEVEERYEVLEFGDLLSFEFDWTVPETAWLPSRGKQSLSEVDEDQGLLFE